MTIKLKFESIMVPLPSTDQLHMTRFYLDKKNLGAPVFILHTAFHNSESFYANDGSGIACFLANQGYDVFVADLRGKGKSWPLVSSNSDFGSHQHITEDIPALLGRIVKKRGLAPQIWIGHGWGGVLLSSFYGRYGDSVCPVSRMIHFGVRRQTLFDRFRKNMISLFIYRFIAPLMTRTVGYFPAKALRLGKSDESSRCYQDFQQWSMSDDWIDIEDGFSYKKAINETKWPASFYIASKTDSLFGHPDDVRQFIRELGDHDGRMMLLSKKDGNGRDYSHFDMVNHKDSDSDHFPVLLNWLKEAKV